MPAMIAALVLAFGVVGVKVVAQQMLGRMNRQISQVAQIKSEALGRLKSASSQKQVVAKNKTILEKKKAKVAKKIGGLKREMAAFKEEEKARRQRTESRRVS